jgi:hypothetical protein
MAIKHYKFQFYLVVSIFKGKENKNVKRGGDYEGEKKIEKLKYL